MIGTGPSAAATGGLPWTRVRAHSRRLLKRALRERVALEPDCEPRGVHHDEHVLEAGVRLADQVADRAVLLPIGHDAGRRRMNAELVLDGQAVDVVALAERAVGARQELRHDEQRNAFHAAGRAVDARQHEMHDVRREVVLAVGDEDLLAEQPVVIALGHCAHPHLREIRARLRLGEIHRAGPLAADQLRQIGLLLPGRADLLQRLDRAVREHWT